MYYLAKATATPSISSSTRYQRPCSVSALSSPLRLSSLCYLHPLVTLTLAFSAVPKSPVNALSCRHGSLAVLFTGITLCNSLSDLLDSSLPKGGKFHMRFMSSASTVQTPSGVGIVAMKSKQSPEGSDSTPPRITSNVKQNLQFLKYWKELQKRNAATPKPATSYRRKKLPKEDLPEDTEHYQDPTLTLYYTNQGLETAVPVLLVDGYNVCGYWPKLKKHFMNGRLDMARQKLIDELVSFSLVRDVKVVVVFDAMMSGLPTHTENFVGIAVLMLFTQQKHAPMLG